MKKRIGNDITFVWHIYRKSGESQVPESFTGKEVEVKLISPLQRPVTIEDVSIATGVVTFTFRGKHQVTLGNYVAVLQENRGEDGMVTLDVVSAVTLVPHSYMEEDGDDGDVIEASSVELESTISAGGGTPIDAYTKAETDALLEGKYDKVDGIRFLAGQRQIVVQDENGQATTTISPTEVQFEEVNGTQSAEIWLNGGYLRLNDKYHTSPTGNKIATDLELAGKQNTINDLATIRSGASAGSTAVQPSDLTPIDDRLDDVEYCLGDYIKDTYVFNARNKPEVSSEPVYTDTKLYTTVNKNGSFKSLNCKLSSDSQAVSALWIGRLYDNGKILFTQSGTATLYLVLYANLSSLGRMLLSVCDSNDNVVMNVHSSELTYNSSKVCTAFSCEVAEGYYIKMEYNDPNVCVWLGQIDLEINEVKQISTDVHANSAAIEAIEQKIPAQASSSNKLVDGNSLAPVATSGSYNDLSDKPDLSNFITNSVDDLVNYYLKSETYTKTEVLQLIGAIQQFHYEVYPTLPQTGASNVLYLIGPTGSGSDKYEEYVYANNDWAKIGDTSIDLSGYVTTQALATALADYVTSSALSTILSNYVNKDEIDDVPTANSKNPVTSGGVYDALLGEYVVATATANTGSVTTAKVGIYDVNDVLIVEGEGEVTARILYGKTYKVKCSRVYDYLTPAEQTFVASIPSRQVTMQYTYIERDVVTLDQTISDSAQMPSGDIQGDVIKEIRLHSHLYLGTPATQSGDTEGTELLCQLSDEDSRLYYDGTPAALDGSEGDQWLKLPVFWWKVVGVGEAAADGAHDQYRLMFAFAGEPDPSWNKWQGDRNLVGAKEMKVVDGKGRSVSDGQSTGNLTQAQGNAYAEARNLGCQEVTWEWQWMMCMLCYAWNGDTNSQKTNGIGSNSYSRTLGVTDQLGMTDTTPAQATSLTSARFWGLEAWWNCKYEWLGNVVMENYVLSITDQDTKQTRQVSGFIQCDGSGGWNSRMRIDANGDFVPLANAGTETTYYCDWVNSNSGFRVLDRSSSNAHAYGGVACVYASAPPSYTGEHYGSRLAFNGVITEAESVAAYKAALA